MNKTNAMPLALKPRRGASIPKADRRTGLLGRASSKAVTTSAHPSAALSWSKMAAGLGPCGDEDEVLDRQSGLEGCRANACRCIGAPARSMFDPLRNDPRFQKLAESAAPKE